MAGLPVCDVMSEPLLRSGSLLRIGAKGACRKVEAWLFPSRLLLTGTSAMRKTLVLDQQVSTHEDTHRRCTSQRWV